MQGRLYRSLKVWSMYCDLEESLGTLESTCAVYDRILELRIATPQIILNYGELLWVGFYTPSCTAHMIACASFCNIRGHFRPILREIAVWIR